MTRLQTPRLIVCSLFHPLPSDISRDHGHVPPVFAGIRLRQEGADHGAIAVSINDTVKMLGVGRTSIYEMIKDGRLEAFKLGRRTLVKAESIRRLVDGQN